MKHRVLTLLFTALLLRPAAGLSAGQPELKRYEGSVDAMGGAFTIVAYGDDAARLETSVAAALEEARRLDELLSNYRPESEWSRVNQLAGKQPVRISQELFDLLSACVEYSRESEGAFDITVGPLMKVWGFYKGTGHLPHRAEVRGALDRVGWRNIQLDSAARTVHFARPGVEIDPGGIGKGYAVDRLAAILERQGVRRALISAASSSIYAIGAPPHERGWRIGIKDPKDHLKTVATVWLRDQSMSTSGNYEKFFYAEGKMYSHIMDPRTGYPSMGTLSVSVITPRTIDSEAWAKPYYILGRDWAAKHRKKEFRIFYCEDRLDTPCAWLQ
ncbi:MAG TPA: FAD:protein FMN transferase [Bryobacteraceae bacterium]|nr:FAD:protein FMN transferase [Bryobacteraceae bacterium]